MPDSTGSPTSLDAHYPRIRVEPQPGWVPLELRGLIAYRNLLAILTLRDVRARYKQTLAGVTWVLIQPLLTMVVFSVFFGSWLELSQRAGAPYPVFTFCALVPWTYFVHALTMASSSVVGNHQLVTKVHFPRLILPLSAVLGGLVDLAASLLVLIPLLWFYAVVPDLRLLLLPLFVGLAALTALSFGILLAAVNVRYRDVRQALPFVMQLWMFCTPVAYPLGVVPERFRGLLWLNPMTTVCQGFRWVFSAGDAPPADLFTLSLAVMITLLVGSAYWFRREEVRFADII